MDIEKKLTWKDICDKGLAGQYAKLKGVSAVSLFENLNGSDEVILTEKEKESLLDVDSKTGPKKSKNGNN